MRIPCAKCLETGHDESPTRRTILFTQGRELQVWKFNNMRTKKYTTATGRCIYCFQVRAFPQLLANIYLISDGDKWILVDTGSGMEESNLDLQSGIEAIGQEHGEPVELAKLDAILISHGHIDHFGGVPFVREHCLSQAYQVVQILSC